MLPESLLSGENAAFLDQQYRAWLADPASVEPTWQKLFASMEPPANGGAVRRPLPGSPPAFHPRSIFDPYGGGGTNRAGELASAHRQARVVQLINAWRVRGHLESDIDPLDRRKKTDHPELTLAYYGLSEGDLEAIVPTSPLYGLPPEAPLAAILDRLRAVYAGAIGVECMNIDVLEQKQWVLEQLETLPDRQVLSHAQDQHVLGKLADAENFERMLHTRYPGTKRFSLEGAETLIPLLDLLVEGCAALGAVEIVLGMAHRGRLNVLANTLEKPIQLIVNEFDGAVGRTQGSGDVKYHLGYSADRVTADGHRIHLSLTFNPSHLEAVDPLVEGRVRAKQDRSGDTSRGACIPVLLHGDSAFAGQGLVPECLNLSELSGYTTGGTIHVIVNNQIGFTTPPSEARSTPYATSVARMLGIPIFHVNGEDPRAVAAVVQIAVAWRQRYKRDVVIDMYCYRKYGHNEGDEPSFTQPQMYKLIRSRPTPREVYQQRLIDTKALSVAEVEAINAASRQRFDVAMPEAEALLTDEVKAEHSKGIDPDLALYRSKSSNEGTRAVRGDVELESPLKGLWQRYRGSIEDEVDTGFPLEQLQQLLRRATELPPEFSPHAKIKRLMKQRRDIADGTRPVDWAMGEQAAYATLLVAQHPVRLSGQDCGRGTFSHRHAALTDITNCNDYIPMANLQPDQARFEVIDSSLSEASVLGFELGYSMDYPEGLVMWEAQFGDFANGAQVIIDQFLCSSEEKWNRVTGLVMLLPHGYEGQGPEHSSAKLERYLQLCADGNMQVANCTTPANFFHLLRRQVLRRVRKPLVVMTPKSLLRHAQAVSTLDDLANGAFQRIIPEHQELEDVKRVVLCSGKIYYELLSRRQELRQEQVALVRVELLHPFPIEALRAEFARYPNAAFVWCQEEPANMGAWPSYFHWFHQHFPGHLPRYIGRRPAASPATGSHKKHVAQQTALIDAALTL